MMDMRDERTPQGPTGLDERLEQALGEILQDSRTSPGEKSGSADADPPRTRKPWGKPLLKRGLPVAGERGITMTNLEQVNADYETSVPRANEVGFATLLPDEKRYVEARVRGMSPYDAVVHMAREKNERATRNCLVVRAHRWEKRFKHLIADMVRAESMSDMEFDSWSERAVQELAESVNTSARMTAIEWLRDRREQRRYRDLAAVMRTIEQRSSRMRELSALAVDASKRGMTDNPAVADVAQ